MLTGLAGTIVQQARSSLCEIEVDVKQFVQLCKSQWARLASTVSIQTHQGLSECMSLLPTGKGRFLELWAPKQAGREGWTHMVEQLGERQI